MSILENNNIPNLSALMLALATAFNKRNLPELKKLSRKYLTAVVSHVNIPDACTNELRSIRSQLLFSALYVANAVTEIHDKNDFRYSSPYLNLARKVMGEYRFEIKNNTSPLIPWAKTSSIMNSYDDAMHPLLILGLFLRLKEHNPLKFNLNMYSALEQLTKRSFDVTEPFESALSIENRNNTDYIFKYLKLLTHHEFMDFLGKNNTRHAELLNTLIHSEQPEYQKKLLNILSDHVDQGWNTLYNTNIFQNSVVGRYSLARTVKELICDLSEEIKSHYDSLENLGFEIEDIIFKLPAICTADNAITTSVQLPEMD